MKLFLQKNAKFSSAGGSAPRPPNSSPLRISGYAPVFFFVPFCRSIKLSYWYGYFEIWHFLLYSATSRHHSHKPALVSGYVKMLLYFLHILNCHQKLKFLHFEKLVQLFKSSLLIKANFALLFDFRFEWKFTGKKYKKANV